MAMTGVALCVLAAASAVYGKLPVMVAELDEETTESASRSGRSIRETGSRTRR